MEPSGLRMVNYYPVNNAGYEMWFSSNYSGATYLADMQKAAALGFGCCRVFIPATSNAVGFPSPSTAELGRLQDFYSQSKTAGVQLRLCLFDWWSTWGKIAGATEWATAVLGALPDFGNIQSIELQNEMPFAETSNSQNPYSNGFDSGWPSNIAHPGNIGQVVQVFAQQMIPVVRQLAPGVPVTVSTTAVPSYNLAAAVSCLNGAAQPDWFEWHCYQPPGGALYWTAQALATVEGGGLVIGEVGRSSDPTGSLSAAQAAQIEADYIAECRLACALLGLPEPAPWMLYDVNVSAQFPSGQTFGLYDTSGAAKPAADLYVSAPPGSPGTPPVPRLATAGGQWFRRP